MREDLSEAENLARLERAVRRLPRLRRDVFLAIRLEDMGYPEIAERTGLSIGEVERHFADSLVSIANALDRPTRVSIWKQLLRWLKEPR